MEGQCPHANFLEERTKKAEKRVKELQAKVKAFKDWHKANPDSHDAYCESRTQEMDMESMKWKGFPKCNCGLDELLAEDK